MEIPAKSSLSGTVTHVFSEMQCIIAETIAADVTFMCFRARSNGKHKSFRETTTACENGGYKRIHKVRIQEELSNLSFEFYQFENKDTPIFDKHGKSRIQVCILELDDVNRQTENLVNGLQGVGVNIRSIPKSWFSLPLFLNGDFFVLFSKVEHCVFGGDNRVLLVILQGFGITDIPDDRGIMGPLEEDGRA
ncbi:hypothetical protein CEXT_617651 [Caerostris extrusa]|uniref:Uncharacterized protein n=1 Tax=Caerostris extrusa TaxID=172846 RepID=A0AAV4PVN5_CAEEX|nr:hypothetical protein CEXT_617651 [Caerostris extrusa]